MIAHSTLLVLSILGPFLIILPIVGLLMLAFEIWMFVDVVQNPRLTPETKLLWALGILLIHPIGAIVYYFVGRPASSKHR